MTATATTTVPEELNSPRAKLVYLYLSTHGDTTVRELHETLRMSRLTLYSVLRTLCERELVRKDGDRYALG